mmetsp:Transcript_2380/g.6324  ORF Transcript_2380/g.6324 Transcript_2380/m.6324 type:complete len:164 (+) Transcript_2380:162-653(+)
MSGKKMGVRFDESLNQVRIYELMEPEEKRGRRKPTKGKRKSKPPARPRILQRHKRTTTTTRITMQQQDAYLLRTINRLCIVLILELCIATMLVPTARTQIFSATRNFLQNSSSLFHKHDDIITLEEEKIPHFDMETYLVDQRRQQQSFRHQSSSHQDGSNNEL